MILALAAGLVAGCGGDDESGEPIPAEQAGALERQLDSIENRFQFGSAACTDITGGTDPNTAVVRSTIDSLPQNVDPEVRSALESSFERLFQLVQDECAAQQEEEPPPAETTPPETAPPEDDEGDDDDDEEEQEAPPAETGPTVTEPPAEVPPEGPTGATGQGGTGSSGEGGSGTAGQGGGGGALVPGDLP